MDERGSGEILLKTRAFGGFEKTQVLAYIDKLREENRQAEEELEAKIASISQAKDALSESIGQFEGQIRQLESQLTAKKDKINELTGVIDTLGNEISQHKQTLAAKDQEIKSYQETNRRLSFAAEANGEKAKRYSELTTQVGEIIIEARRSAADIVEAAQAAAEISHRDLLGTARRMADEMTGFRQDIAEIRHTVGQMTDSINTRIDAIETAACDLEKRLADTVVDKTEESALSSTEVKSEAGDGDPDDTPADYLPETAEDETYEEPSSPIQDQPTVPPGGRPGGSSGGTASPRRSFFQGGSFLRPR